jgi:hypothetical protein
MLFATMSFDDEDPDLHVHMTKRAHDLEDHHPHELVRVLKVMEEALASQAVRVGRVRATIEGRLLQEQNQRGTT